MASAAWRHCWYHHYEHDARGTTAGFTGLSRYAVVQWRRLWHGDDTPYGLSLATSLRLRLVIILKSVICYVWRHEFGGGRFTVTVGWLLTWRHGRHAASSSLSRRISLRAYVTRSGGIVTRLSAPRQDTLISHYRPSRVVTLKERWFCCQLAKTRGRWLYYWLLFTRPRHITLAKAYVISHSTIRRGGIIMARAPAHAAHVKKTVFNTESDATEETTADITRQYELYTYTVMSARIGIRV